MAHRHKHADMIHAWAEGAEIEAKWPLDSKWHDVSSADCITWEPSIEYRIKPAEPEKKPDVVAYCLIFNNQGRETIAMQSSSPFQNYSGAYAHIKIVRDGDTGKLIKAEVL